MRERDRSASRAALIAAAVMIAQQVGSKATRDALFLSSFDPEDLPTVVIASAAASLVAVLTATRAYARFGPARVVPVAFASSAALYGAEWLLVQTAPRPIAVTVYLHTAIFGALVISGFWSVVNERFDPHSAKHVVSRIGTGATFGGVAGGLLAERFGEWGDANAMLLALGLLNAMAAVGVSRIGTTRRPREQASFQWNGLEVLRRASYLRTLASLVLLTATSAALLDYALKAQAAHHFEHDSDALLRFFALFHVGAALLSFLLQTGLAKPTLERLGVAGSAATLPMVVLGAGAAGALVPRLATVVLARAAELVVANSTFRSGYELLYTPVDPNEKRPTKALIDVAGNRIGDGLGSGLVLIAIAVAGALTVPVVLGLAAVMAACSLWVARRLHSGYVRQLEDSLRKSSPTTLELRDAATLQTLSTLGLDREALFEQLAAQQSWSERLAHPRLDGEDETDPRTPDGIDAPLNDPIHAAARTLRSGDSDSIRALLSEHPLDPRLTHHAIALLARRDVHREAIVALRGVVDDVADRLVAALRDPDQPFAIRRRLPRVLEASDRSTAVEGLLEGLDDDRFEVRYWCALALARITARHPPLRPPVGRIHEVVSRELETGRKVWESRRLLDDDAEEEVPLLDRALRDRIHRSVEHVFTLLSLAYDPEPLRLSLLALAGDDQTLRGTALEYLENVLPETIRDSLFPMLDARVELRRKRSRDDIVEDLVRSMRSMDAAVLRRDVSRASAPPAEDERDALRGGPDGGGR